MDFFWQDVYAKEHRENLYYPFTSSKEWQFSSWCMCSGLSMSTIDSLLSLNITKQASLSFQTAKELQACVESLPARLPWLCEHMKTDYPTRQAVHLFYHPALECLQSLLNHPLLTPHISFIPWKVWTSAAQIFHIYEDWLSGDRTFAIQDKLPEGSTVLGIILSSDKMNILVMSGNRMAYPLLMSLANIIPEIHSKISMHTYLLFALLPIPKFLASKVFCMTGLSTKH
ncbi:hypothetical protein EDC04DRAFT_2574795 [Pisolithus marmoratus]|nr:hypothetical protein EDC04DRAFT_2574795 [Pisolithus marmoratus]